MWRRLRCLFGKHHRDRGKVREGGRHRRSVCDSCGKPMIKDHKGWRVVRTSDIATLDDGNPRL